MKSSAPLLKKQSTTASLRAMFSGAALEDSDSEGVDEADGDAGEDGAAKGRMKRKSKPVLPPTTEVAPKVVKSGTRNMITFSEIYISHSYLNLDTSSM